MDAADKVKSEKLKEKLFREGEHVDLLSDDLAILSDRLCSISYELLVSQGYMEPCTVDAVSSQYYGQRAYEIAKEADTDSNPQQREEAIDLACQSIQTNPLTLDAYLALYQALDNKEEVFRLAQFVGMEQRYLAAKDDMLTSIINDIVAEPAKTPKDFDAKIEQLNLLHEQDPDNNSYIHKNVLDLISKYQTEKQALIEKEEELRLKAVQEAEAEAARQAALAEARAKAAVWKEQLEQSKLQAAEVIEKVQNYMDKNDLASVWQLTEESCIYAEYVLTTYYIDKISPAIDNVNAEKFNQITASIRNYVKQGNLFAKYLLSICSMSFWVDAVEDEEKALKMMRNCVKAAELGCISAMATVGELLDEDDMSELLPGITKTPSDFLKIAAEKQHPSAMWSYGTLRQENAGNDLEQQAIAEYFLSMAQFYGYVPPKPQKESASSDGCFVTSAVCRTFGKPDNCYELTMFRAFRDEWLIKQPDGLRLIEEYYQAAPAIVAEIDRRPDSETIYQSIWDTYLQPCLHYIETEQYSACKNTYADMINRLRLVYRPENCLH